MFKNKQNDYNLIHLAQLEICYKHYQQEANIHGDGVINILQNLPFCNVHSLLTSYHIDTLSSSIFVLAFNV